VDATVTVGGFTFPLALARATVLYQSKGTDVSGQPGTQPSFTFSGDVEEAKTKLIRVMPVSFKQRMHADGWINLNDGGLSSYVDLGGSLDLNAVLDKLEIDGTLHLSPQTNTFKGVAHFAGVNVNVDGTVTNTLFSVGGSTKVKWKKSGYGIEATLRPRITVQGSRGSYDWNHSSAKACIAGSCSGIGIKKLEVGSDGHIKLCVNLAGATVCAPNL
jgi:hypothetical protein